MLLNKSFQFGIIQTFIYYSIVSGKVHLKKKLEMVVDSQLYDLLGVSPDATERDLKKAFLRKARETHPDKNKDDPQATEKFQAINEAYKVLSDPKKRKNYDKYGLDGLREDQDLDFNDFFSHLFNISPEDMRPRTKDIIKKLFVTLEEEYNGAEKKVTIKRHVACKACQGKGTKSGKEGTICKTCGGQGQCIISKRVGHQIRQTIGVCPDCDGEGEIIDEDDQCPSCNGKRYFEEERELLVHVERGAEDGDHIVFQGVSDESPGAETGDVIFVIREKEHNLFERRYNNLLYHKHITLSEALYGAKFVITHLDGRKLVIQSNPEKVIQTGDVEIIENEGMPVKGDSFQKGQLFIEYIVDMPKREDLNADFKNALLKTIPIIDESKDLDKNAEDVFIVTPIEGEIEQFKLSKKSKRAKRREAYHTSSEYDDEEEDIFGEEEEEEEYMDDDGPNVNCGPM